MSQQKEAFSRDTLLTMILISGVVIASVAFGFWIGTFSPRIEKIHFSSCQWSEDACTLSIANTGADELVINKVWINNTLLDSTEWESFPSMRFQPGDEGELYITPSSTIIKKGTTYQFTIGTITGKSFSYTAVAESGFIEGDSETDRLKEKLAFEYIFYHDASGNLTVYLLNSGTIAIEIQTVYIFDSNNAVFEIFSNPKLYSFESWDEIQSLGEGRLVLPLPGLSKGFWSIRVMTVRGSTFDSGFVV